MRESANIYPNICESGMVTKSVYSELKCEIGVGTLAVEAECQS